MRPPAVLLASLLALQPGLCRAQALDEAADLAGSAGTGDRRFDGALNSRTPSDAVTAAESPASKKTLDAPAPEKKLLQRYPPTPPKEAKLDLDSPAAKRGRIKGGLIGAGAGGLTGAIAGWAIFGSLFGIIGLAILGAGLAAAIGQDAGRHCGADPECG
jgi:hypothetical protein